MFCCVWRLLFGLFGFKWLARPADPKNEAEAERWRERRRRFRSKVRAAMAELLTDDEAGA